ncbi:MAG: hypothetical protein QW334_01630 [Thermofilum sp.]
MIERDDELKSLLGTVSDLAQRTEALVISSDEDLAWAGDQLAQIIGLRRRVEEKRKFFVDPLNAQVKQINAVFKRWLEPLERAERKLRDAIAAYKTEQERKRREQEEFLRKKREILERLARNKGVELAVPPPVDLPPVVSAVKTHTGSTVATRKVWTFRVVDLSLVPREYLVLDESKVRKAIAAGVREIPGLEIYQEEKVVVVS